MRMFEDDRIQAAFEIPLEACQFSDARRASPKIASGKHRAASNGSGGGRGSRTADCSTEKVSPPVRRVEYIFKPKEFGGVRCVDAFPNSHVAVLGRWGQNPVGKGCLMLPPRAAVVGYSRPVICCTLLEKLVDALLVASTCSYPLWCRLCSLITSSQYPTSERIASSWHSECTPMSHLPKTNSGR